MYSLGPDNWARLIVWLVIGQILFFTYGRRYSKLRAARPARYTLVDRAMSFANIGFLAGGIAGYLIRPVTAAGARLDFQTVLERGINLKEPGLRLLAQSSFNSMVLYAFLGAALGALVGWAIHRFREAGGLKPAAG
jgi:hypothetical protein